MENYKDAIKSCVSDRERRNVPELKIQYRDTVGLIPYVSNSRTHTDEQVTQIASSMKEFGFTNPVLVDDEGGIIAGHGRVMAAKKLGLDSVPTIQLDGLTAAQKKAYVIADNQLALNAGWDLGALKLEIENLQELDFDTEVLGFDDDFLASLMDEPVDGLTDEDARKCGARGGHYNDGELKETETLKLAYRVESFLAIDRVKAIELFAGQGALTSWYKRSFENVVSNDIQVFENVTHAHNLSASAFIKKELAKHLDFDFIDFDDEGCPAKELQEFFKIIKHKKEPFVLAITDGQGLNLKCHGKINFKRTYMIRDDATVNAKTEDYYNFTEIFREFMSIVTQGFNYKELSLYLKDNGNVIYATYLIEKA